MDAFNARIVFDIICYHYKVLSHGCATDKQVEILYRQALLTQALTLLGINKNGGRERNNIYCRKESVDKLPVFLISSTTTIPIFQFCYRNFGNVNIGRRNFRESTSYILLSTQQKNHDIRI